MCSTRILATRGGKRTKGAAGPIRALWFKSLSEPVHRLHIASKLSSKSICNLTGAANPGSSLTVTLLAVRAGLRTLAWFFAASAFFTLGPMQGTAEARRVLDPTTPPLFSWFAMVQGQISSLAGCGFLKLVL